MIKQIEGLLKPWAGVFTWDTSHALDEDRFYKSMQSIHEKLGSDIPRDDFKQALKNVVSSHSNTVTEEEIDRYVEKALGAIGAFDYK